MGSRGWWRTGMTGEYGDTPGASRWRQPVEGKRRRSSRATRRAAEVARDGGVRSIGHGGGAGGDRTLYLFNAIEALSRVSYSPTAGIHDSKWRIWLASLLRSHFSCAGLSASSPRASPLATFALIFISSRFPSSAYVGNLSQCPRLLRSMVLGFLRARHWSVPKVGSKLRCREFSILQWAHSAPVSSRSGSSR